MSEAMIVPPLNEAETKRIPTVYFIDDSATMREVIKIAFRRESINVITCADAASALAQFEQNKPDVVITDVIMPDQDGYSVCSQIKQHPDYGGVPVVLMSGVVNKSVADKAVAVKADELIRKPFQPQELIGRVKSLLEPKRAGDAPVVERPSLRVCSTVCSRRHLLRLRVPQQRRLPLQNKRPQTLFGQELLPKHSSRRGLARLLNRICSSQALILPGRLPLPQTYKNCVQKSLASTCSSKSCKQKCKSSGNIRKRSNSRSKRSLASIRNGFHALRLRLANYFAERQREKLTLGS